VSECLEKRGNQGVGEVGGEKKKKKNFKRGGGWGGGLELFGGGGGVMVYYHTHKTSDGPYQEPVQSSLKFHTHFL